MAIKEKPSKLQLQLNKFVPFLRAALSDLLQLNCNHRKLLNERENSMPKSCCETARRWAISGWLSPGRSDACSIQRWSEELQAPHSETKVMVDGLLNSDGRLPAAMWQNVGKMWKQKSIEAGRKCSKISSFCFRYSIAQSWIAWHDLLKSFLSMFGC